MIRLNSDLGSKTGWYEVVKDVAVGQSFVTRGYPEDLLKKENKINLWKTTGKVTQLSDKRIYMDADVIGGQSGSPILTDNKLFGVVAYSMSNVNSATRINNRELNWIQGYANDAVPVYRLYNQTTGEHLYTSNMVEVNSLTTLYATPWKFEKAARCGTTTGKPVYRVYNPNNGDHHYTVSASERDSLVRLGWKFENIARNARILLPNRFTVCIIQTQQLAHTIIRWIPMSAIHWYAWDGLMKGLLGIAHEKV